MTGLPGATPEPYVVRRIGVAQVVPVLLVAALIAVDELAGSDLPTVLIIFAGAFALSRAMLDTERLRVDAEGVRVRPARRIPWAQIDAVSARGPDAVGVRLKPGAPLPGGVRGMVDGALTLHTGGVEIDPARLARAVAAYSDAGGSFSGMPGSGASSSGMSAGGPSG